MKPQFAAAAAWQKDSHQQETASLCGTLAVGGCNELPACVQALLELMLVVLTPSPVTSPVTAAAGFLVDGKRVDRETVVAWLNRVYHVIMGRTYEEPGQRERQREGTFAGLQPLVSFAGAHALHQAFMQRSAGSSLCVTHGMSSCVTVYSLQAWRCC